MTIADAFEGVITRPVSAAPASADTQAAVPPAADVRDDPAVTAGPSWLARAGTAVTDDLRGAWLWDTHGLTLRALWEARIPARERVPAENGALWKAWCAYNHAALAVLAPLLFVAWVLGHPARLLYAAPVAVPLTVLWLS